MNTLVCFALKEEAGSLRRGQHFSILITGIGKMNAEKSIREFLAKNSKELVLTCGFAGSLNPDLKLGDVIFESGKRKAKSENWEERLLAAGAKPAEFFCADRIATTATEKRKLRAQTGADAVEMESAAIHAVCAERGIACVTVRVISDAANEDLPLDFNALSKADKNLDYGKLFLAIATSPRKITALLELQRKTKFAARQLASVLEKIIS
jgi:adenosylhomocysteine nucleosidase